MTVIVKEQYLPNTVFITFVVLSQSFDCIGITDISNKGNNKITELRSILQRESQNS
jgi:hypothetical protein